MIASIVLAVVAMAAPLLNQQGGSRLAEYQAAARTGDSSAQNELGIILAEGQGINANNRMAVYWFRRSATGGNGYGACNLGLHYACGGGIRKDRVLALKWIFIGHSLDSLHCHPEDFLPSLRLRRGQIRMAWAAAVVWLRAHPNLTNDFGDHPWFRVGSQRIRR